MYAETDPEMDVAVRPFDDPVEVEVRDDAPPIPGNGSDPLVGDGETDELSHGTGPGRWLVYWVVDLSVGDIEFQCPGDAGNVGTVSLALADP